MSIQYDPNNIFRGGRPAIDGAMAKRSLKTRSGTQNTSSTALDVTISANYDWQLDTVGFSFNNATSRSFSASIVGGRKVMSRYNDALWFSINSSTPQRIVLSEGFYTGTALAAELQSKMNANVIFAAAGITFTVAYDTSTGEFTIGPNTGDVKYHQTAKQTLPSLNDSTGGYLFGLTTTTAFNTVITSDTAVYGLDSDIPFIAQNASTALSYFHDTAKSLSIDQGVRILSQVASTIVTYEITYEEIV